MMFFFLKDFDDYVPFFVGIIGPMDKTERLKMATLLSK